MMRDSQQLERWPALLALLWASAGCLSMEPISSYSEGVSEVAEVPAALQPEAAMLLPDEPEVAEVTPPDAGPAVQEGPPGDGELGLAPGVSEEEPSSPQPGSSCAGPGEFASADGAGCYLASSQNAVWSDALSSCEAWGGSLVTIDSSAEEAFLAERVSTSFWIGASDRVQEGRMLWSGGAPLAFANWSPGQPDDFQGREDCVVKTVPAGTWNDRPCSNVIAYVCERSQD